MCISSCYTCVKGYGHGYVLDVSVEGILQALNQLVESDGVKAVMEKFEQSATNAERDAIRNFLSTADAKTYRFQNILRSMPVFWTLDGSGFKPSQLTSLDHVHHVAPSEQV